MVGRFSSACKFFGVKVEKQLFGIATQAEISQTILARI